MKDRFMLITLFCFACPAIAQFQVDTLQKSGPLSRQINLVFLSDGYQEAELDQFIDDATLFTEKVFSISPFKEYRNYFNVFAVKVPSVQSGASHPKTSSDNDCIPVPQGSVDNYFGSVFDYGGIHRLLVPTKNVGSTLSSHFPLYDQAFIIVNTEYYGGSGGTYATSSVHEAGAEISIHEIGHSFAQLADEYWAGPGYAAEKPNMTQQSSTTNVKWKKWVGTGGVSVYPFEENAAWFRPHQSCKMRYLGVDFCKVCTETFTERIHSLVNPVLDYEPKSHVLDLEQEALTFSLQTLNPEPNTLKITWKNNNKVIGRNVQSVSIPVSSFISTVHTIRAEIIDTTLLVRTDLHTTNHLRVIDWTVNTDVVTDVEVIATERMYKIESYPNPVAETFTVKYELPKTTHVSVTFTDVTGKVLSVLTDNVYQPGEHIFTIAPSSVGMRKAGVYILRVSMDGTTLAQRIVKE